MASKSAQRVFLWVAVIALLVLSALSVTGALLGPARARTMFTSLPGTIGWAFLALLLLVGFGTFLALRRRFGLAAMHLGALMILVGSAVGSPEVHALWHAPNPGQIHRGYIVIESEMTRTRTDVYDDSLGAPVAELPFAIAMTDFQETYHLPPDGHWTVMFEFHQDGMIYQMPVNTASDSSQVMPAGDLTLTVLNVRPAVYEYDDNEGIQQVDPFFIELVATHDGRQTPIPPQQSPNDTSAFWVSFEPLYPTRDAWVASGTPILEIAGPVAALRDQRVELTLQDLAGQTHIGTVAANEPFWHAGYLFYLEGVDPESGMAVLSVVSDTGWSLTWSGLMVLLAGSVWYGWSVLFRRGGTN
jgi:hypothetical protein